ncbi:MAG: hypothetical protein ACOC2R_03595 [Spirochaetota bacterium]
MKKSHIYIAAMTVLLLLPLIDTAALGGREKPAEGAVLTEEAFREIEVYVVHPAPGSGSGIGVPRPQGQAVWYLFQDVQVSGGTVQVQGKRQLAGPILTRESLQLNGDFQMTRFAMKVEPATQVSYRNPREVEVNVAADELISSGRIVLQPAQRAVVKAAGKLKGDRALIRVKSMRMDHRGQWTAVVEIADPAE